MGKGKNSHVKIDRFFIWDSGRIEYFILIENNFRTILILNNSFSRVSIVNFASILSVPKLYLRLNCTASEQNSALWCAFSTLSVNFKFSSFDLHPTSVRIDTVRASAIFHYGLFNYCIEYSYCLYSS
jgi:hypothetical protein